MAKKKKISPEELEARQASALGSLMISFRKTFVDFFDDSLDTYFESRRLHPSQQQALTDYVKYLKTQLNFALNSWSSLLSAFSFSLRRNKDPDGDEQEEDCDEDE